MAIKQLSYSDKLKDPRWQKLRLEIMQRDWFTCQHCRSKEKTLNVHHHAYKKGASPWDYEPDWLITLCEECHEEHEDFLLSLRLRSSKMRRGSRLELSNYLGLLDLDVDHYQFGLAFFLSELLHQLNSDSEPEMDFDGNICTKDLDKTVLYLISQLCNISHSWAKLKTGPEPE